jgi:chromosome segregation ATPase
MDDNKKPSNKGGRISYKQKFENLEKVHNILIDESNKMQNEIIKANGIINDMESEIKECNSIINTNNYIITSLESKIGELETTILHLKTKVPKDTTKDRNKLKGIRFENGKFTKNGIVYNSVEEAKNG